MIELSSRLAHKPLVQADRQKECTFSIGQQACHHPNVAHINYALLSPFDDSDQSRNVFGKNGCAAAAHLEIQVDNVVRVVSDVRLVALQS